MAPKKSGKRKYNKRRGEKRDNQQKNIDRFTDEEHIKWLPRIIRLYQLHVIKLCDAGVKMNSKNKEKDDLIKRIDRLATICAKTGLSDKWDVLSPEMKQVAKAGFKIHHNFPLTQDEICMHAIFMGCSKVGEEE